MIDRRRLLFGMTALALASSGRAGAQGARPLTVFAASSLTDVLQALGEQYRTETKDEVRFSFASSSVIARQLEAGAPADLFFSADAEWMDYVQTRSLIQRDTRVNLLSNRLVLVAPTSSNVQLRIAPGFGLAEALGRRGRLAMGDPDTVPAGRYARTALTSLGVWNDVADRLVRTENVRAALLFVSRGEAPLGVVYHTDALVEPKVRVVDTFPPASHTPIVYPAAVTRGAQPSAARFLAYVRSPAGLAVFRRFGFITL